MSGSEDCTVLLWHWNARSKAIVGEGEVRWSHSFQSVTIIERYEIMLIPFLVLWYPFQQGLNFECYPQLTSVVFTFSLSKKCLFKS